MPKSGSPKKLLESLTLKGKSIFDPENKDFLNRNKDNKWLKFLIKAKQLLDTYEEGAVLDMVLKQYITLHNLSPKANIDLNQTVVIGTPSATKFNLGSQITDHNLIKNTIQLAILEINPTLEHAKLQAESAKETEARPVAETESKKTNLLDQLASFFSNLFATSKNALDKLLGNKKTPAEPRHEPESYTDELEVEVISKPPAHPPKSILQPPKEQNLGTPKQVQGVIFSNTVPDKDVPSPVEEDNVSGKTPNNKPQ